VHSAAYEPTERRRVALGRDFPADAGSCYGALAMTWRRTAAFFGLGAVLCGAGGALAFGPVVRARAEAAAGRRGLAIEVGAVRPRWGGLVLRQVTVRAKELPSLWVELDEVRVDATVGGRVEAVTVLGGQVHANGTIAALRQEVDAFAAARAKGPAASPPAGTPKTAMKLTMSGLSVFWKGGADGEAVLQRVQLSRDEAGVKASVGEGKLVGPVGLGLDTGGVLVLVEDGAMGLGRDEAAVHGYRLTSLTSKRLAVTLPSAPDSAEPSLPAAPASAASPRRPPGNAAKTKDATTEVLAAKPTDSGRFSPALVARAKRAAEKAHALARTATSLLPADATIALDGVEASFSASGKPMHIGPHRLTIRAAPERLDVQLTPGVPLPGRPPLALEASIPTESTGEISVGLRGGPIPLSVLGLKEGDGGLLDVEHGTVEANGRVTLSADADVVKIEGGGAVGELSVRHRALSTEPIRGLSASFHLDGELALDGSHLRIDRGELDVGSVHATLSGEVFRNEKGNKVRLSYAVPLAACQGLLDALPQGLAPKLAGMKMTGMLAVKGAVAFDGQNPVDQPEVSLDVINECRVSYAPPEVAIARFRKPFQHQVYGPDGTKTEITSGPGSPGWVPSMGISRFMEGAIRVCEDGRFRTHRGFDFEAIRNSIRENVKAGRFVRGASTVTMQTVKNIWLDRDKTLGRKLSEAVLTVYLEQEATKDEILELYLNDIEFGPMIYGIGPAAQHYFRTSPADLSLSQALYLASILPSPNKVHFGAGGRLTPGRAKYLWMLMKTMERRHLIDSVELADGLREVPVFGQSAPQRSGPEPGEIDPNEAGPLSPPDEGGLFLPLGAELGEKSAEPRARLVGENVRDDLEAVVQPEIVANREQRADGARLRVTCSVDDAADTRVDEGPGAHRARLERDDEGGVRQSPRPAFLGCSTERDDFCVPRRIASLFADILAGREQTSVVVQHDGANRHVSPGGCFVCGGQRQPHGGCPGGLEGTVGFACFGGVVHRGLSAPG
jgi:hypothetical protein